MINDELCKMLFINDLYDFKIVIYAIHIYQQSFALTILLFFCFLKPLFSVFVLNLSVNERRRSLKLHCLLGNFDDL